MTAVILPFRRPAATSPRQLADGLPSRAASVGEIWIEIGSCAIWQVVEILDVGPNEPGRWPRFIRDVCLAPQGGRRHPATDRWMREKTLLCNFERPEEYAASEAALRPFQEALAARRSEPADD